MRFELQNSVLALSALASSLMVVVEAKPMNSCEAQAACVTMQAVRSPLGICQSECEWEACLKLTMQGNQCPNSISHTCKKPNLLCENSLYNTTGFPKTDPNGNTYGDEIAPVDRLNTQCQIVGPNALVEFLIKDGSGCSGSATVPDPFGGTATCRPRDAGTESCTGNAVGKECIWTYRTPACPQPIPAPPTATEPPTNEPTSEPTYSPTKTPTTPAPTPKPTTLAPSPAPTVNPFKTCNGNLHSFMATATGQTAITVQNSDLGANFIVLSTDIGDNVNLELKDLFLNHVGQKWITPASGPDCLPGAGKVMQGSFWAGDMALTSPNAVFDCSNTELYGVRGIFSVSENSARSVTDCFQIQYSPFGGQLDPVITPSTRKNAMPGRGVIYNADFTATIRPELLQYENFCTQLRTEVTLRPGKGLPSSGGIENYPLFEIDVDQYDTNNDGVAVIDIDMNDENFLITNSNVIIESSKKTLAIFRILGQSNMIVKQASILVGDGVLNAGVATTCSEPSYSVGKFGAIFVKASNFPGSSATSAGEPTSGNDTVFDFTDFVINGIGIYDFIAFGSENAANDDGKTVASFKNGQGCGHFVAPTINFDNVRLQRCSCSGSGDFNEVPTTPIPPPSLPPTKAPTKAPTGEPTKAPTKVPTKAPTGEPTKAPTKAPTKSPTGEPTKAPTKAPTKSPTGEPTKAPTKVPTKAPTGEPTKEPTKAPTKAPTKTPTGEPTPPPTKIPTNEPTKPPTKTPTKIPTKAPTLKPSMSPTHNPFRKCGGLVKEFLIIGTGGGKALEVTSSDLGSDIVVLSTEIRDNVNLALKSIFLDGVGGKWTSPGNGPDCLPGAGKVHQGVSWSGDIALTAPEAFFDATNTEIYADKGIIAESNNPGGTVNNCGFYTGTNTDPILDSNSIGQPMPDFGVTTNQASMQELRTELLGLENWLTEMEPDVTLSPTNGLPSAGGIVNQPQFELDVDLYDKNYDGIAVIDIDMGGADFVISNSNWIIESSAGTFAVIRILGESNVVVNNASIMVGDGVFNEVATNVCGSSSFKFGSLGAAFVKASTFPGSMAGGETVSSMDEVFSFKNTVLNGIGIYDLVSYSSAEGYINNGFTKISITNSQGCAQFISPSLTFNNVRFEKCSCEVNGIKVPTPPVPPPTDAPTKVPTKSPTDTPTASPTKKPTSSPTKVPTDEPTKAPTNTPTEGPTRTPTEEPTKGPTKTPTEGPTRTPTEEPSKEPTKAPTGEPTLSPTKIPTGEPTRSPTKKPTNAPTMSPTFNPFRKCGGLVKQYMMIGTGSQTPAIDVRGSDLGSDIVVLSTNINDNVQANLMNVFLQNNGQKWISPETGPNCLPGAGKVHQGVSWSGDFALTSPNGVFDATNVELYAQTGVVSASFNPGNSVTNCGFYTGSNTDPILDANSVGLAMPANGITTDASQMASLRAELVGLENWLTELEPDITISPGNGLPSPSGIEGQDLFEFNVDQYDKNGDEIAVIDIDMNGEDFHVTGSNWVIESTNGVFAVFRLLGESRMVVEASSIMVGDGVINAANANQCGSSSFKFGSLGAVFIKAGDYPGSMKSGGVNKKQTVFDLNTVVLNGIGIYDLIVFNSAEGDNDYGQTETFIAHAQGCAQFIGAKITFHNVRFEKCSCEINGVIVPTPPQPPPTDSPTKSPTKIPTKAPTKAPTGEPTTSPTDTPTTKAPTKEPTKSPTGEPTKSPTPGPTKAPTGEPTAYPTEGPTTKIPTLKPTFYEPGGTKTRTPTLKPTLYEPGSTKTRSPSGVNGDPHFKTWSGELYDFHGICDLVLIQNPKFRGGVGMDIHVRSKKTRQWSYVSTAVLRIGSETFEVAGEKDGNHFWINKVGGYQLPEGSTIAGYPIMYTQLNSQQKEYVVDLGRDERIVFRTWKDFVRVDVKGKHAESFGDSLGLMGTWPSGLKVGRDNATVFDKLNKFGQEWQVQVSEQKYFHLVEGPQHPQSCEIPTKMALRRRLAESTMSIEEAENACIHVNEDERDLCIFDVFATGDKDAAGAY